MKIIDLAFHDIKQIDAEQLQNTRRWSHALIVPQELSAEVVSSIVDLNKSELILVVDPDSIICGITTPETVISRARQHLPIYFPETATFENVVVELAKISTPTKRGFEWLNTQRPTLHWCHPGKHLTSQKPCSEHQGQT